MSLSDTPNITLRVLLTGDPFDLYALLFDEPTHRYDLNRSMELNPGIRERQLVVNGYNISLIIDYPGWAELRSCCRTTLSMGMQERYKLADIILIIYQRDGGKSNFNVNPEQLWKEAKERCCPVNVKNTAIYTICRSFLYRHAIVCDAGTGYKIASTETDFNWVLRNVCSRLYPHKKRKEVTFEKSYNSLNMKSNLDEIHLLDLVSEEVVVNADWGCSIEENDDKKESDKSNKLSCCCQIQ